MSWRGALIGLLALALRGAAPAWDASPAWDLRATLAADGRSLAVEGRFAPGDADTFLVEAEAAPFVSGVEVDREGRWEPVAPQDGQWRVSGAEARGARLRWRFDLAAASAVRGSGVRRFGDGYLARPRTFVLRPEEFIAGRAARLAV
ncbi:MAG TPA: hypothetical protein VFT46_09060, partial [Holophagaceae bacterium]|nr:hypothetical protein [Holophagaceae bacterium]